MEANTLVSRLENLGLENANSFKLKKLWNGEPYYYNISGAHISKEGDVVFQASPYGQLDMKKLVEDLKETSESLNGIVRVGSFKIHAVKPRHGNEGMFVITQSDKKKGVNFFSFLLNMF
ncbi:MAG: hypothetical protein L7V85_08395 [Bacteroidia bacterium]|nr:hypothetical protein [Bacteroidia bacterium]